MTKDKQNIPRIYWDSNVFLSAINGPKERLPIIEAILDDCAAENSELYTSMLSITEVAFAESEKASRKLDDKIEEKINKLWYPLSPVKLVEINEFVILEAKNLIRSAVQEGWSLKPADAIHLATAKRLGPIEIHTYEKAWTKIFCNDWLQDRSTQDWTDTFYQLTREQEYPNEKQDQE